MTNLIVCVVMFYILHLFLVMGFSLHKVPFIQWTYTGGDLSAKTALSERMGSAGDNLRQSLPIFMVLAVLSVILEVDNLMQNLRIFQNPYLLKKSLVTLHVMYFAKL